VSLPEPPICPMETITDLKNVSKMATSVIDEHCANGNFIHNVNMVTVNCNTYQYYSIFSF